MIVEAFDNAWHVLRYWLTEGYSHFVVDQEGRIPTPRPSRLPDIPPGAVAGLDYFPIPPLQDPSYGDNPDPDRPLTVAEILVATAIAEGWEPEIQ